MAERDFNLQMTGEQVKDALQQLEDRVAEGWAVGEKDGTPVTSGSPYYENNAKYYAEQAGISAQAAADSAATAEQEVEEGIRQGIVGTYVQESATPGAIVTIDDGADDVPLKDLKVNLAINQPGTGDPSPSNVRPIYPVTEAEVSRTGKNLFNFSAVTLTASKYVNALTGELTSWGASRGATSLYRIKGGATYTLSGTALMVGATNSGIAWYDKSQNYVGGLVIPQGATSATFTLPDNAEYIRFNINTGYTTMDVQIELGSTATTYEPYAGQQYLVNIGINQWDEEWELGRYDDSGEKYDSTTIIRCKNRIPVLPNTAYYMHSASSYKLIQYDKAGTFISATGKSANSSFTTSANCYYIAFNLSAEYGTTYLNDISVNFPARFTEYRPYTGHTVYGGELDVTTGVLTARYASVDMGSVDWGMNNTGGFVFSGFPNIKVGLSDLFSSQYTHMTTGWSWSNFDSYPDKVIARTENGTAVYVKDLSYTNKTDFKAAMNGVQLVYELATPISIQLTPTEVDTLRGDNVIWADCGDITNCEYRADLKMYIDKVVGA